MRWSLLTDALNADFCLGGVIRDVISEASWVLVLSMRLCNWLTSQLAKMYLYVERREGLSLQCCNEEKFLTPCKIPAVSAENA